LRARGFAAGAGSPLDAASCAATTRATVLCVVPQIAAAPRKLPTCW
jgi:hypothetical protein